MESVALGTAGLEVNKLVTAVSKVDNVGPVFVTRVSELDNVGPASVTCCVMLSRLELVVLRVDRPLSELIDMAGLDATAELDVAPRS